MTLPNKLSLNPKSPHYDMGEAERVDKVFVDEVHVPQCYAYDADAGWAMQIFNGIWGPKIHGVVKVTEKA